MSTSSAFTDELSRLDATATAEAVRAGDVSPVEVLDAAVARVEAVDPQLGAVATADFERARAVAVRLGSVRLADLPFAGVPTIVKDNADVAGLPTRHGSEALTGARPAVHTEKLIQQLFDMGTVSLGKSTLPEFGFSPSREHADGRTTRNPWGLDRTAGGSSSGSAALVAAGALPLAHGADGGGSIRIPAACCGLVGLKPTRGRLVRSPDSEKMPVDIVAEGVLTRSVRDTVTYFREAERRFRNPGLPSVGSVQGPVAGTLRIGVIAESPTGGVLDEPTRRQLDATLDLLEGLGHQLVPVTLPPVGPFVEDFLHYWSLLVFSVVVGGKRLYDPSFDKRRLTPFTLGLARRFRHDILRTPGNLVRMRRSTRTFESAFAGVDAVVSPTLSTVAPPLGHLDSDLPYDVLLPRLLEWIPFTPMANATGMPSISLPLGHDDATGLPVGVCFTAATGCDPLLLELALQLEEATPFRTLGD